MKKLFFTTAICFFSLTLLSQPCFPEGIEFNTQEQIDNFPIDNPNCTIIEGNVIISSIQVWEDHITNLDGLSEITAIGGNLKVYYNPYLQNLSGFENLFSIDGYLEISENYPINDLSGLENLNSVGGGLYILGNESLLNIDALSNLNSVGESNSIQIINNPHLLNLLGLDNIDSGSISDLYIFINNELSICDAQSICEYLSAPNGIVRIYDNATGCNLTDIANECSITLPCLPYGYYYLKNQTDIDNFEINFPGCSELDGNVYINGETIENLDGLSVLTSVNGNLEIGSYSSSNPLLTNLSGLDNLTSIGENLNIEESDALISLTGLEGLTKTGGLYINSNDLLANLTGLNDLDSVSDRIEIIFNPILTSLQGLSNLDYVGDKLRVSINPSLNDITALESLTSIGGILELDQNYSLTSLNGLHNITSIGGGLHISHNTSLTNLDKLSSLISIGGYLGISGSIFLDLSGLESLNSIGGDITIRDNTDLRSLEGIENIEANSINNMYIVFNELLSTCEVTSICNYLSNPNGEVYIQYNSIGCNSLEEVEEACETVSIEEIYLNGEITSFPNPFTSSVTILYELKQPEKVTLTVYDYLGKQIYHTAENQPQGSQEITWNAQGYAEGVYYYRLSAGDQVVTGKLIKTPQ